MIRRPPAVTAARTTPAPAPVAQDPLAAFIEMMNNFYGGTQVAAPTLPPVPTVPELPLVPPDLGPEDIAYFDALESRNNQQYQQSSAQNVYQQGTLGLENTISERDLNDRFNQMRDQLPGQYQRRGLMNSGIYGQGLNDYARTRTNASTDLSRRFQNQMGGLGLAQQQLTGTWESTAQQAKAARQARKNAIASTIRTVR